MSEPQINNRELTEAIASLAELTQTTMEFALRLADDVERLTARVSALEQLDQMVDKFNAARSARNVTDLHKRN